MLTEKTAVKDGTIKFGFFHLVDHINQNGCHVMVKNPRHALKVNAHLVLGTEMRHFLIKGVVDVVLTESNEEDHLYCLCIIKGNIMCLE